MGVHQGTLYSSANFWKEPLKARRLKKKEEENAPAIHLVFDLDNRNEDSDGWR
jgi:hypothetical protein